MRVPEQIAGLEREVQAAQAALFSRESELLDLRAEWAILERQYEARIGSRLAELESLEAEIKACRQQLDEVRIWGRGGIRQRFGAQVASVGEQVWQARQASTSGFSFASFAERLAGQPRWGSPPLSPEDEAQLKTLYRKLSRRFHPDLAQDETERACRTERMTRINAAYTARDRHELELLVALPDCDAITEAFVAEQRLASLQDTLQRIQRRLQEIDGQIDQLVHGDLIELSVEIKLARRQGRDRWAEMEADVEAALAEKRAELAALIEQLQAYGIGPDSKWWCSPPRS